MSDTEQREIAETLFEPSQTREEIRDAIKLEEERRAALVKNLYRLRGIRLSRDRGRHAVPGRVKSATLIDTGGSTHFADKSCTRS